MRVSVLARRALFRLDEFAQVGFRHVRVSVAPEFAPRADEFGVVWTQAYGERRGFERVWDERVELSVFLAHARGAQGVRVVVYGLDLENLFGERAVYSVRLRGVAWRERRGQ